MKLKYTIGLFLAALLFSLNVSAAEINGYGTVNASVLNVRTMPDINAEAKYKLMSGESVEIVTKTGEWFEILFQNELLYVHSDYIICSRQKPAKEPGVTTQSPEGQKKAAELIEFAKTFLGTPYQWGGKSPETGFDCSGFVYYVYGEFGVDLYRVAKDQIKNGVNVDLDYLMPGDIVLFWNRTSYSEINHVGIYVGDGEFIHSPQTGDVIKFTTLESGYYSNNLVAARRIFE